MSRQRSEIVGIPSWGLASLTSFFQIGKDWMRNRGALAHQAFTTFKLPGANIKQGGFVGYVKPPGIHRDCSHCFRSGIDSLVWRCHFGLVTALRQHLLVSLFGVNH